MRILILFIVTCSLSFAQENKVAKKVVALSPATVELLFTLGAGDRIVATVEYADYPEQAKKIPRIGNYLGIQIEKLVELYPDLVVVWQTGNKASDLKKIESLGFDVLYLNPANIGDIAQDLIKLGDKLGLQEKANNVAQSLLNKYQAIKAVYKNKRSISVFYQLWHQPLRSVGPKSWVGSLLNDCNAANIFSTASDYPLVSKEDVIVKNPEVIIVAGHGKVESTQLWEKWPELQAVAKKQIYQVEGDTLHRFSTRALDGLEKLCQLIDQAR